MRSLWEESALRAAINKYSEAEQLWSSDGELANAAEALCNIGDVYDILGDYPNSLGHYTKALSLSEAAGSRHWMLVALNGLSHTHIQLGETKLAEKYATRALDRAAGPASTGSNVSARSHEAWALNNLGEIHYSTDDLSEAGAFFERALVICEENDDARCKATVSLNLGYWRASTGDVQKAKGHFEQALALWQSLDEQLGIARAMSALSTAHSLSQEEQTALELARDAASICRRIGNRQTEAVALNGIGQVYENLHETELALDSYEQSSQLLRAIGDQSLLAVVQYVIAGIHSRRGNNEQALQHYQQVLQLGKHRLQAYALKEMAIIYDAAGQKTSALKQMNLCFDLHMKMGNPREGAYALYDIGNINYAIGDKRQALNNFSRAARMFKAAGDQPGETLMLFNGARVERDAGHLTEALSLIREAVAAVELPGGEVGSARSQAFYNTSSRRYYELYIDLLMQLHKGSPAAGFDAEALLVKERERTYSLMGALAEEKISLRLRGNLDNLLRNERELRQQLNTKAAYRARLLGGESVEELLRKTPRSGPPNGADVAKQLQETGAELRALTIEYQDLRARIRELNPRYAVLMQPEILQVRDIQREIEGDTLLLAFALGDERSYLWAVSGDGLESYELPGRDAIESAARQVYDLLTARSAVPGAPDESYAARVEAADALYAERAAVLSRMLLGGLSGKLGHKRLLVVSDGLLQFLPLEVLPDPDTAAAIDRADNNESERRGRTEPLLLAHEVIVMPSASTLLAVRLGENQATPKLIAILADPVFREDDPRVRAAFVGGELDNRPGDINPSSALRDFNMPRLSHTLEEAENCEPGPPGFINDSHGLRGKPRPAI